jgi:hypothetical protein
MSGEREPDRTVGMMARKRRETFAVVLRTYEGNRFVDVRVMVARPGDGAIPTGMGLTLNPGSIPELVAALQRAHASAVKDGWCGGDGA